MKRYVTAVFALAFIFSSAPVVTMCYGAPNRKETVIERVGDWFRTLGEEDIEKDLILAERRSERAARRVEKIAEKAAKQAERYDRHR